MKTFTRTLALFLLLPALASAQMPSGASQNDAEVKKDLQSVLALQGKPCGAIVSLKRQAENDYLVVCKDGHHYRIFIDENQRVTIEERD